MVAILYVWEKKECLAVHETFHNHEIVSAVCTINFVGCGLSRLIRSTDMMLAAISFIIHANNYWYVTDRAT